jgi:hypothetical protein
MTAETETRRASQCVHAQQELGSAVRQGAGILAEAVPARAGRSTCGEKRRRTKELGFGTLKSGRQATRIPPFESREMGAGGNTRRMVPEDAHRYGEGSRRDECEEQSPRNGNRPQYRAAPVPAMTGGKEEHSKSRSRGVPGLTGRRGWPCRGQTMLPISANGSPSPQK